MHLEPGAAIASVMGAYSALTYWMFVRRVTHYAKTHVHVEVVEFADAIRPTVVAAISRVFTSPRTGKVEIPD